MADLVRKTDYFKALIPNKPGEGAKVLNALRAAGVALVAMWGYPMGARAKQAALELIPETAAGFGKIARKAGLEGVEKLSGAFLVCGEDRIGAMAEVLSKLADAGINVQSAKGISSGEGRFGAAVFVAPEDAKKAAKALGVK